MKKVFFIIFLIFLWIYLLIIFLTKIKEEKMIQEKKSNELLFQNYTKLYCDQENKDKIIKIMDFHRSSEGDLSGLKCEKNCLFLPYSEKLEDQYQVDAFFSQNYVHINKYISGKRCRYQKFIKMTMENEKIEADVRMGVSLKSEVLLYIIRGTCSLFQLENI
jgi:hypothetical protein